MRSRVRRPLLLGVLVLLAVAAVTAALGLRSVDDASGSLPGAIAPSTTRSASDDGVARSNDAPIPSAGESSGRSDISHADATAAVPTLPGDASPHATGAVPAAPAPSVPGSPAPAPTAAPVPTAPAPTSPPSQPQTSVPAPLAGATAPAPDPSRVVVGADIASLFTWDEPVDAALAVLRASGPLPSLAASHHTIHANLSTALGGYVPSVVDFADAVAEAYERTLTTIIDEQADVDSGLCVVLSTVGDAVSCLQVPELWATPSVNAMRSVAVAEVAAHLSGPAAHDVDVLIDTNFSGGNLWALLRGANAAFLAAELRHGWARAGVDVRGTDRTVGAHLLFLRVYAAQVNGTSSWTTVATPPIQTAIGRVWNLGRSQWWSTDSDLGALIYSSNHAELSRVTAGVAVTAAPQ